LYVSAAFAFIAIIVVSSVNQWVQRKVRERLAHLTENQIKHCPFCGELINLEISESIQVEPNEQPRSKQ
jgi:hypothetical protein